MDENANKPAFIHLTLPESACNIWLKKYNQSCLNRELSVYAHDENAMAKITPRMIEDHNLFYRGIGLEPNKVITKDTNIFVWNLQQYFFEAINRQKYLIILIVMLRRKGMITHSVVDSINAEIDNIFNECVRNIKTAIVFAYRSIDSRNRGVCIQTIMEMVNCIRSIRKFDIIEACLLEDDLKASLAEASAGDDELNIRKIMLIL
jgi:hypothetical protein